MAKFIEVTEECEGEYIKHFINVEGITNVFPLVFEDYSTRICMSSGSSLEVIESYDDIKNMISSK